MLRINHNPSLITKSFDRHWIELVITYYKVAFPLLKILKS